MTDYGKRYRDAQEGVGGTAEKRLRARKLSPENETLANRYDLSPQDFEEYRNSRGEQEVAKRAGGVAKPDRRRRHRSGLTPRHARLPIRSEGSEAVRSSPSRR